MGAEMAARRQSADIAGPDQRPHSRTRSLHSASTRPASAAGSSSESTARSEPRAAPIFSAASISIPITVAARRKPQLPLAGEQHIPGFVLLLADQRVHAIGAELAVGSGLASGAGQVVFPAGFAVLGPSARLEVPAAKGPQPFFAALRSAWRSVNSGNKRSPTG
jgi:hypothetical protein